MERIYEVIVVFGEFTAKAASIDELSACLTACGQVWSEHTMAEMKNGYGVSMPMISTFKSVKQLQEFLNEMSEGDIEPWLTMMIKHTDC